MRRSRAGWVTALVLGTGTAGLTQKVVGLDELDRAMKTIGTAIESVQDAVGSEGYLAAKIPLALSRQVLASTRPVWETAGEPDAVRMNREAVAALDALDAVLSTSAVEAGAVRAAVENVTRACHACHASYREGDETTGYRIKSARR